MGRCAAIGTVPTSGVDARLACFARHGILSSVELDTCLVCLPLSPSVLLLFLPMCRADEDFAVVGFHLDKATLVLRARRERNSGLAFGSKSEHTNLLMRDFGVN